MKRPKRVKVIFTEVKATTSKYTCPFCRVTFMGGVKPNVITNAPAPEPLTPQKDDLPF